MRHTWLQALLILPILVGCTNLPFIATVPSSRSSTPEAGASPTATEAQQTATITTPEVTPPVTPPATGSFLRLWVPPDFDPEGTGAANGLLKEKLDEFLGENPDVRLEVRVKALNGEGGMLEALVAANVSAPLTLPDLVLLPRPLLESAALKELLFPYNGLTIEMDDRNWFGYAQQLARVKTTTYGVPFAGDAMVLVYHPSLVESTPHDLDSLLPLAKELLFPAADPQALFTLAVYLQSGGSLQDEQGRPYLDKTILTNVLDFEKHAGLAGVMPYYLTQYSNDEQVWEAFMEDQFPMAVTWASSYLKYGLNASDDLEIAPLPTWDGSPYTLATGWGWALAGHDPERRALGVRLVEFLLDKDFIASWSLAAGYLPVRVDALQGWQDSNLRQSIEQISYSAHLVPSIDMISSLGPALEVAVVEVLKAESEPDAAAQAVIDRVNQP